MSTVDARKLLEFLEELGKCYHHPGTIYLVGGSSLLLLAAKESTLDIDLTFEFPPAHEAYFEETLPEVETFNLRADPEGFRLKFEWLKAKWEERR